MEVQVVQILKEKNKEPFISFLKNKIEKYLDYDRGQFFVFLKKSSQF